VKDPMLRSSEADEDTKTRLAGFAAKNKVMADLVNAISRSVWVVTKVQHFLFQFILWYEGGDVADLVKAAFVVSDLADDVPYTSNAFSLFADLILYDMLHTYVQSYFVVSGATGEFSVDSLHQKHDEDLIQGLDEAQRELIYNKFRKVPWLDRTRPPVDGYRDLLKYWGGHFTPGPEKECYGHMQ